MSALIRKSKTSRNGSKTLPGYDARPGREAKKEIVGEAWLARVVADRRMKKTALTKAASLLSWLILYNGFLAAAHLIENDIGGSFPDERLGLFIPSCEPRVDGAFQFVD